MKTPIRNEGGAIRAGKKLIAVAVAEQADDAARIASEIVRRVNAYDALVDACETLVAIEAQPPQNRNAVLLVAIEKAITALDPAPSPPAP